MGVEYFTRQVCYSHAHSSEDFVQIYLDELSSRNLAKIITWLLAVVW